MRENFKNFWSLGQRGMYMVVAGLLSATLLALLLPTKAYANPVNVVKAIDKTGNIQSYRGFPSTAQKIYAAAGGAFVIDANGDLYGMGSNDCGIFGDPEAVGYNLTNPIKINGISSVVDFTVAGYNGVAVAIKSDGTVWSWGCNDPLARSSMGEYFDSVPGIISGIANATQVKSGASHVLVRTGSGQVYVWGHDTNSYGALGTGDETNAEELVPVMLSDLNNVIDIAAGEYYSLALKSDGSVWEWGAVYTGENAIGFFPRNFSPALVNQLSGMQITAVEAAFGGAYAITQSGDVYSWGTDCEGSLGLSFVANTGCQDNTSNVLNPTLSDALSGVSRVSANEWIAAVQTSTGLTIVGGGWGCDTCTFTSPNQYNSPASLTGLNIIDFSSGPLDLVYYITQATDDLDPPVLSGLGWSSNPKSLGQQSVLTLAATDGLSGVLGGEYFIGDTDPGQGNGAAMNWDGTNLSTTFGTDFAAGVYKVSVRAKDNAGNWSEPVSDYLVVYDPNGPRMTGKRTITPSLGNGDVLPGLISGSQADAATFAFSVKYDGSGTISGNSDLQLKYQTGTKCKNASQAQNCHSFNLDASSIAWLTTQGTNNSAGIFQGTATLLVDGVSSQVTFRVTGVDGSRLSSTSSDSFEVRVFAQGADPNTATPIYVINPTSLTQGDIKIV